MDRFEALRTLITAVDAGSLSAASRTLGVPLPTISRRVSDLEAELGARLLVRTNRKLLVTDAGASFVASARRILDDLAEAERVAAGEYRTPRGALLITAPIRFGTLHVGPVVHEFLAATPEVSVRLLLSDSVLDLPETRVDAAIRIGRLADSVLRARRVGHVRWVLCASPAYLGRRGAPSCPADIARHDCVSFDRTESNRTWPFMQDGEVAAITVRPRLSVNTAEAAIGAAVAGLGLVHIMSYQAIDAVRAGLVVPLLDDFAPPPVPVHLVHAPQMPQPLKQRAFIDFAAPRLQRRLAEIGAALPAV